MGGIPFSLRADAEILAQHLQSIKTSHLCHSTLPADEVYIQFVGPFEDKAVVWNTHIVTIEYYAKSHDVADDPRQFIEIHQQDGCYVLQVGLNLAQITSTVIEQTIIMIRNYKRLHEGRHEYGAKSKTA